MIKFYSSNAPEWWPFQVVSLTHKRLPPKKTEYYYMIVDNGMYSFVLRNERPDLDIWINKLRRFVYEVYRTRRPIEIIVVLPDWFKDPGFTISVARNYSRLFCKDWICMTVAHYDLQTPMDKAIEILLSIDGIELIGVPCKLYCSRQAKNRRIANYTCMKTLVEIAYSVTRNRDKIHALGLGLRKELLESVKNKIRSFDNSTWTRPIKSMQRRHSAKTIKEREEYFKMVLREYSSYMYIPDKIIQVLQGV